MRTDFTVDSNPKKFCVSFQISRIPTHLKKTKAHIEKHYPNKMPNNLKSSKIMISCRQSNNSTLENPIQKVDSSEKYPHFLMLYRIKSMKQEGFNNKNIFLCIVHVDD
jgi:hypothetical protein